MGMDIVSAMRPFPFAGSAAKTGVRNVSIIAAVAVLLTNIEKKPVMSRNPSRTFSDFLPKGLMRLRARSTSRPNFEAAIARVKPPRNSMMTGSAKLAMIAFDFRSVPKASDSSALKNVSALFDTVRHIVMIMTSEVAQAGIASVSQERVANTKIAIIRCWTTVRPSMPKLSVGRFHTTMVAMSVNTNDNTFFMFNAFDFSSFTAMLIIGF